MKNKKSKKLIGEEVKKFFSEQMSINPEEVIVDMHSDCIVVTLQNAIPAAEVAYASDNNSSYLLSEFYGDMYQQSKSLLESSLKDAAGIRIADSCINYHPKSGNLIVIINLD